MVKDLIYFSIITTLSFSLFGCLLHTGNSLSSIEEAKLNTVKDPEISLPTAESVGIIPSIPSLKELKIPNEIEHQESSKIAAPLDEYDWKSVIDSMVSKMLKEESIPYNSTLLVDFVNNQTNGWLDMQEATEMLHNVLSHNRKFALITVKQLSLKKQKLGLRPKDRLSSRSKTIGIARNLEAEYVLYSNAIGNLDSPYLEMQLMLVKTGEIVWSEKGSIPKF